MRRAFAPLALLLMLVLGLVPLAACDAAKEAAQGAVQSELEKAFGELLSGAGYELDGTPTYDGTRWTANVRLTGCPTLIQIGGNETEKLAIPTSFSVLAVDGTPMSELSPGTDVTNLPATSLKALEVLQYKLNCAT
jgi:hypothetical protein